jgi:hypothetical protein
MPLENLDMLPPTGLIIPGIAAVLVYETNSKTCIVECMICNKDRDKQVREEALDELVAVLLHMMKEKGFKYITSNSTNPKVVALAKKHGFIINEKPCFAFTRSL